jgi:hypothetical protein
MWQDYQAGKLERRANRLLKRVLKILNERGVGVKIMSPSAGHRNSTALLAWFGEHRVKETQGDCGKIVTIAFAMTDKDKDHGCAGIITHWTFSGAPRDGYDYIYWQPETEAVNLPRIKYACAHRLFVAVTDCAHDPLLDW